MESYPKYLKFISIYRKQSFAIPNTFIFYITKNPSTSEVYEKLIQSCKHFFIKNPILVVKYLKFDENEGVSEINKTSYIIKNYKNGSLKKLLSKIWLTGRLQIFANSQSAILLELLPKIFRCDIYYLDLEKQIISFENLLLISKNVSKCCLLETIINDKNGTEILFEVFVEKLPKLVSVLCRFHPQSTSFTSETFNNFMKLCQNRRTFRYIGLMNVPQIFDIAPFYKFIKEYKFTRVTLSFKNPIPAVYKQKIYKIIDEILALREFYINPEDIGWLFIPPTIEFPEMNLYKKYAMREIANKFTFIV